jgi:hypothetical protein
MRSDISKVIVERPKYKPYGFGYDKGMKRRQQGVDPDDLPSRVSIREKGRNQKFSTDYLTPIERFLGKNVGKPWDNVYSEIREQLNPTTTMQYHVLQHIPDFVELNPMPVSLPGRRKSAYLDHEGHTLRQKYYVDPHGYLRRTDPKWRSVVWWENFNRVGKMEARKLGNRNFRKIQGRWWEITLERLPKAFVEFHRTPYVRGKYDKFEQLAQELKLFDVLLNEPIRPYMDERLARLYGGQPLAGPLYFARSKRLMSDKEARRLLLPVEQTLKAPNVVRRGKRG